MSAHVELFNTQRRNGNDEHGDHYHPDRLAAAAWRRRLLLASGTLTQGFVGCIESRLGAGNSGPDEVFLPVPESVPTFLLDDPRGHGKADQGADRKDNEDRI